MTRHRRKKHFSENPTTQVHDPNHDIKVRAYQLYEERGREDGHDLDDWLRAEKEITQRKARAAAA